MESGRIWEVDVARAAALAAMVVYHLVWDLRAYGGYDINVYTGFWGCWQAATAGLFTLLVGASLTLSHRRERRSRPKGSLWGKYAARGATIFAWGLVISAVTYIGMGPERYVRFGILHLIGASIVLAYPLLRFRWLNLALGAAVIGVGTVVEVFRPDLPLLQWLAPMPGSGADYAPLFPMFGWVLVGIFVGNTLYPGGARRIGSASPGDNPVFEALRRVGQNSLPIYLVHQPILIGALFVTGVAQW